MAIYLPKRCNIYKTGDEDPVFYHYFPIVGFIYKRRLKNTLSLLGSNRYERLLEIGYGSGLLLPELKRRCNRLYAIDIHNKKESVYKMLKKEGVEAELVSGSILDLPYEDESFNAVVSVSVLEHLTVLDRAVGEIKRVMKKGGVGVLSFPVKNKITDLFYRLVGYCPSDIHPSGHREIESAVSKQLRIVDKKVFPSFKNDDYSLYMSLKCVKG